MLRQIRIFYFIKISNRPGMTHSRNPSSQFINPWTPRRTLWYHFLLYQRLQLRRRHPTPQHVTQTITPGSTGPVNGEHVKSTPPGRCVPTPVGLEKDGRRRKRFLFQILQTLGSAQKTVLNVAARLNQSETRISSSPPLMEHAIPFPSGISSTCLK